MLDIKLIAYFIPMLLIVMAYIFIKARNQRHNSSILDTSMNSGLMEPASLHPLIDNRQCIGCGACVSACPENKVLGVVNGKAELINPSYCIGHGACKVACPTNAITLVFGTEKRGIDIPMVSPNFETNVAGIFIAGELGGMGLIRNAIEQGRQAIESIKKLDGIGQGTDLDVVIIGAGPAGISASLAAMEGKLRSVTIEQDTLGGTVAHYPRGKVVMTAPVNLPMVGKVKLTETTKEALLTMWQEIQKKTGLEINTKERMDDIAKTEDGFMVKTDRASYQTRAVLLVIGRRGTPRTLGVSGEELSKVVYRLIDPGQYRGQHVLVVGGGDSALEAATSIADEEGTTVSISYRSEAFSRAKEKNRKRIQDAESSGRMRVLMKSTVKKISPTHVQINYQDDVIELDNDAVIVCAGGILPTPFLKKIGIEVEVKHGTA